MSDRLLLAPTDGAETEDVAPELNPELDRAQIAGAFRRTGRVHTPDILTNASARRLFRTLERETPWGLIFNEGKKTREFEAVSAEDHQEMAIAAWERAHTSFQYFYFYYRLLVFRIRHKIHLHLAQPCSSLWLRSNQVNHLIGSEH